MRTSKRAIFSKLYSKKKTHGDKGPPQSDIFPKYGLCYHVLCSFLYAGCCKVVLYFVIMKRYVNHVIQEMTIKGEH